MTDRSPNVAVHLYLLGQDGLAAGLEAHRLLVGDREVGTRDLANGRGSRAMG